MSAENSEKKTLQNKSLCSIYTILGNKHFILNKTFF